MRQNLSPDPAGSFRVTPRVGHYNNLNTLVNSCQIPLDLSLTCPATVYYSKTGYIQQMEEIREQADEIRYLVDDNNTAGLLAEISASSGGQVKNTLLNVSPYLSDKVLLEYIFSSPSVGHIKQVILANSPVSEKILKEVNNLQLPSGIQQQINTAQSGISPRQLLENEIEGYERLRDLYKKYVTQSFLHDSTPIDYGDTLLFFIRDLDGLKLFLSQEKQLQLCYQIEQDVIREIDTDHQLISTDILRGDYLAAELMADSHGSTCERCNYSKKLIDIDQSPDKIEIVKTDPSIRSEIEYFTYLGNDRQETVNAKSLLAFADSDILPVIVEPLIFNTQNRIGQVKEDRTFIEHGPKNEQYENGEHKDYFMVYPNPASTYLTVDYSFIKIETTQFIIFDVFGRAVYSQYLYNQMGTISVELNDIAQGMYNYKVLSNDEIVVSEKMIITK
jgi:hypothetical protein